MKTIISVYELLGLIKDGKAPKKIKWKGNIFSFYNSDYLCEDSDFINKHETGYLLCFIFSLPENVLNIKVEVLEEDKPIIEKIDTTTENTLFTMECYTGIPEKAQDWNFNVLKNKLNEVIEFLNRKEDK